MKFLLTLAAVALAATLASAEPIKLTRAQASELYLALTRLEPGLSPTNAISAADNLNELRPSVESLDKGKLAAQRALRRLADAPDRETKAEALADSLDAKAAEEITLNLAPFDLTQDEITAAKVAPRDLATLRRHLRPAKK